MDINDLRGLSTLFMLVSFLGLCFWAYSSKRRSAFSEAANLPFADGDKLINQETMQEEIRND